MLCCNKVLCFVLYSRYKGILKKMDTALVIGNITWAEFINVARKLIITPTARGRLPSDKSSALTASSSVPARHTSRRCWRAVGSSKNVTTRPYDCRASKQGGSEYVFMQSDTYHHCVLCKEAINFGQEMGWNINIESNSRLKCMIEIRGLWSQHGLKCTQ